MFFQRILFRRHLNKGEKLWYVGHKHVIEIALLVFKVSFLWLLIPWGLFALTLSTLIMFLAIIISVIVYIRIMYILLDWYFDAVLITSESLMFVKWEGIFHHESSRIDYHSVESISIKQRGILGVVLGFGEISIERRDAPEISMKNIINPKRLELEIIKGKDTHGSQKMGENSDALKDVLSHLVSEHIKKHGWKH